LAIKKIYFYKAIFFSDKIKREKFKLLIVFKNLRDFEVEHFLRILYVVPHFFVYSWEKLNSAEKDYTLLIGIPSKFEEKMIVIFTFNFYNFKSNLILIIYKKIKFIKK